MSFCGDDLIQCNLISPFLGGGSVVKNSPTIQETGSIPGSGRSSGERNGNHSSILALEIPWREDAGGLQSMGSHRVRHNWAYIHTYTHTHTQLSFSCHDHMGSGGYERVTAQDGMTSSVPLTAEPTVFWPHSHPHPSSHLPSFAKLTLSLPRSLTLGSKVPLATAKGSSHFPLPASPSQQP